MYNKEERERSADSSRGSALISGFHTGGHQRSEPCNRRLAVGCSGFAKGEAHVCVDLVKIDRWERILEKFPARAEKIFTAEEIAHCEKKGKKRAESYAALWGAREAAGKALGIGIFGSAWQDAFVTWTKWGAPVLHLQGTFKKRAEQLGITDMSISISHEEHMAIAVVVMAGGRNDTDKD